MIRVLVLLLPIESLVLVILLVSGDALSALGPAAGAVTTGVGIAFGLAIIAALLRWVIPSRAEGNQTRQQLRRRQNTRAGR